MIHKLKGLIDTLESDHIILDVGGVGYGVFCSGNTLRLLPKTGESASLFIETHVREDHIHLYGFATAEEQEAFQTLVKVSGVGAKMAMAVLSAMTPSQIATAVASADQSAFKAVSGVGPKLASRLITELKDKFKFAGIGVALNAINNDMVAAVAAANNNINDAISALVNLGYGRSDAYSVITTIAIKNDNAEVDILIREGLKELARR
jgi:Holliday junction DNA helicase RuvA